MIENFENVTYELTAKEKEVLPAVIKSFERYTSDNPIKENEIAERFNHGLYGIKMTGARLRKMVNYIRVNGLLPLIATSKGYYVSYDCEVIESQIRSLRQRARSIDNCADGLEEIKINLGTNG